MGMMKKNVFYCPHTESTIHENREDSTCTMYRHLSSRQSVPGDIMNVDPKWGQNQQIRDQKALFGLKDSPGNIYGVK